MVKLCASNTGEKSLIPDGGTRIPHAAQYGQKKKKIKNLLIAYLVKAQQIKTIIFVPRIIINNEIIQSISKNSKEFLAILSRNVSLKPYKQQILNELSYIWKWFFVFNTLYTLVNWE